MEDQQSTYFQSIENSLLKHKKIFILLILLALLGISLAFDAFYIRAKKVQSATDFETCAKAGNPIMESYPPKCKTVDGRTFTQEVNQEQNNPDSTANWKTYNYKKISFKYPNNWVVVFDSTVAGQPNGFSLHVEDKNSSGYQPDQLGLSTYNDREGLDDDNDYQFRPDRKFNKTEKGDDYIQFEVNSIPIYASCAFYKENKNTITICNQILSTFKFLDQGKSFCCAEKPSHKICDINEDGKCDTIDFDVFKKSLGATRESNRYNFNADANFDGIVNSEDASVIQFPFPITLPVDPTPNQTICTQDAKLCPDGSYVGRSGPNCEFTECPK